MRRLKELCTYEQLVILHALVFTNHVEYGEAEACSGKSFQCILAWYCWKFSGRPGRYILTLFTYFLAQYEKRKKNISRMLDLVIFA